MVYMKTSKAVLHCCTSTGCHAKKENEEGYKPTCLLYLDQQKINDEQKQKFGSVKSKFQRIRNNIFHLISSPWYDIRAI